MNDGVLEGSVILLDGLLLRSIDWAMESRLFLLQCPLLDRRTDDLERLVLLSKGGDTDGLLSPPSRFDSSGVECGNSLSSWKYKVSGSECGIHDSTIVPRDSTANVRGSSSTLLRNVLVSNDGVHRAPSVPLENVLPSGCGVHPLSSDLGGRKLPSSAGDAPGK